MKKSIIDRIISEETRQLIDKDCAEFYFTQAEKNLADTIRTSNIITDRAYAFGGMMLTIFIALCGIAGQLLISQNMNIWLLFYCVEGILTCGVSLILLFKKVMFPHEYYPLGKAPQGLKIDEFVQYYHKTEKRIYTNILMDELSVVQMRIDKNQKMNIARAHYAGMAMKIVLYGIYVVVVTLFINGATRFLSLCFN